MIVSGEPVDERRRWPVVPGAEAVRQAGRVARIAGRGAVALPRSVARRASALPLVRNLPCQTPQGEAYFQFAAQHGQGHRPRTSRRRSSAWTPSRTPPRASSRHGLAAERDLFVQPDDSPNREALRHLFFAERAASKIPDVPADTHSRAIQSVAVIGAGAVGGGIAMNFLNAGIPVTMLEMKQEALDRGVATIRRTTKPRSPRAVRARQYEQRMALLKSTTLSTPI